LEYEFPWARLHLSREGVETVFFTPALPMIDLSASMVRQWASLGKDITGLVPECIREDVIRLYGIHDTNEN